MDLDLTIFDMLDLILTCILQYERKVIVDLVESISRRRCLGYSS